MPIKPENRRLYPKNWKAIREEILMRAKWRCECEGECGLHQPKPFVRQCVEEHGQPGVYTRGKIVLTIAHLDHNPRNSRRSNLRAFCQRCHLRYDSKHHQLNASDTRDRKRGQMKLPFATRT